MTAVQTARLIAERKASAAEVVRGYLDRIEKEDGAVRSYITVCEDEAMSAARNADENISRGEAGALLGVPVSVKDNLCTAKVRTTCASKMLENYVPTYDAYVVERLKCEAMPILGKVNLDEFAMGSFGDGSALFRTKNPLGGEYVPGGSSSGSAVSVAAGLACASVGTDTGGSVRIPASFCGLVGFKPTYGAISRFGLIAYASSLDTVGTVTKTVEDAAVLSSVLFGKDERDMTSLEVDALCDEPICLKNITFAFSDSDLENAEREIQDTTVRAADILIRAGAERIDATVFGDSKADDAYKVLACAEATSNLARYDGIKYGGERELTVAEARERLFGSEVKRRIEFGNFVLSAENFDRYYKSAIDERARVMRDLDKLFEKADIILSPLCDFAVPTYAESAAKRADRFTVAANFAGIPAISIPAGRDGRGMPVSVQLMSKKYSDARLLNIAGSLEGLLREEAVL